MNNMFKLQFFGTFFCLFVCLSCNKEDACNPTSAKHIVSEITDSGLSAQYEYESNGRIKRIVTNSGTDISFQFVTTLKSPFVFNQSVDGIKVTDKNGNIIGIYVLFSRPYDQLLGPVLVNEGDLKAIYYESQSGIESYEYNNDGNLIRSSFENPVHPSINLYNWQNGNMTSSSTFLGTRTYEYYTDKVNTLGNDFFGQQFIGVSSKNPIKREISLSSAGNLITDYMYEYDKECYITKVIMTTTDETGKVINSTWREFTYE